MSRSSGTSKKILSSSFNIGRGTWKNSEVLHYRETLGDMLWALKKFQVLPLYRVRETWANSELLLYGEAVRESLHVH